MVTALKTSLTVENNPIREYWTLIQAGKITVSQKVFRAYRKYTRDLDDATGEWYYDAKRANHVIDFAEKYCRHSKGKMAGKPVILELWEKAHLAVVFGFVNINGVRKYRKSVMIVGKKNGKSLLASIVALYMQVGDGEGGPEVYAVATKKDQANIVWNESVRMVRKSPTLKKRIKALVSGLFSAFNDGVYKPVASDYGTLDGLNIHCVLMDEFHQWKNGRPLYNIMADGVGAREQPLIYMTSTAGTVREDIYDEEYAEAENIINGYDDPNGYQDERTALFIYELDARSEWMDPKCWAKANPGLGTIKNLRTLTEKVNRAKANPAMVKNLVCKEFNIRETVGESWMTFEEVDNRETFDIAVLKPNYGIGGYDLSATTDLTAAVVIFRLPDDENLYVIPMFWLPADLLDKRAHEDNIPYDMWRDQGLLRTCEGNRISYKDVVAWFQEIQETHELYLPWHGYDSWSAAYMVEEMKGTFGSESQEAVIQGKKTLSSPMQNLGADMRAHKIIYNNNPCLKWCLTNVSVDIDINGNIQPIKGTSSKRRIDGFAALLNAYVAMERHLENYKNLI